MAGIEGETRIAKSLVKPKKASKVIALVLPDTEAPPRRKPSQERSKERLEKILRAAEACILASGAANLKISDIAEEADMANSSIYQYFKNREQIVQALLERYLALFNEENMQLLSKIASETEFLKYLEELVYGYHDYMKSNLAYQEIWMGSQGWDALRSIDRQDNVRIAHAWVQRVNTFRPGLDPERAFNTFLMCIESGAHITRIAVSVGGKAERIMVDEMIRMLREHLKSFFING
jgi:AcrR family transcriptional regulator